VLSKTVVVDISVEYVKNNPGCSNDDIYYHFKERRRVDGKFLTFPPTKKEISSILTFDDRVYNKNRGMRKTIPEWYITSGVGDR